MKLGKKIKRFLQWYIKTVQKILITLLLTILYGVGFGVTLIFALIFQRRLLAGRGGKAGTFWVEAEGYQPDPDDSIRQS